jgi:PKD repeat protein/tRNA A-37 threonylcarbamoyl transferase component Bud32/tetratricopeptide (TPR) repeat protein
LEKRIGKGGMGQVYLAHQESLDRKVAIKVLPKELASDQTFRLRFEREAKMAANLVHPNVIQMYSYGIEKGIPYFAMEYIDGEDVAAKLKRGERFTIRKTISIVKDVAKALDAAHRRNMVHRDIKPSNVMIASDNSVKVMDFGLAKAARVETAVTQRGIVMGTPPYMSPEQGKGEPLDIRSDLYSLGILFYELLSGQVPFRAETPTAVIYQHIYEKPKSLREFNQDISVELESAVMKMIEKDPKERFQTPAELVEVLTAFETDASTAAAAGPRTLEIDTSRTITAAPVRKKAKWPLVVGVACGCAVAVLAVFFVAKPPLPVPEAKYTANPTTGTAPLTVNFTDTSTGTITSRAWDFENDGTADSTDRNPSYTYNNPGTYTVKLTVTNPGGYDDEVKSGYITVNYPAPEAGFTPNRTSGPSPLTVNFTDTSTGRITSRAWDFDNDGTTDSTEQNPNYMYSSAGTYMVKLTVTGPGGSDDEKQVISVTGEIVANFTATPMRERPLTVNFKDTSTGTVTSWLWDFNNDGVTDSIEQNPNYTYSSAGTYMVKLTVTGPGGFDDEKQVISVTGEIVANFTATPTRERPLTVNFKDTSSGEITSRAWDFENDGTTDSTEQNPSHTYSSAGTYTVKLTVTGRGGTEVKTGNITVNPPVDADVQKGILPFPDLKRTLVDLFGKDVAAGVKVYIREYRSSPFKNMEVSLDKDREMPLGDYAITLVREEKGYEPLEIEASLTEPGEKASFTANLKFNPTREIQSECDTGTSLYEQGKYCAAYRHLKKVHDDAPGYKDVDSFFSRCREVAEKANQAYDDGIRLFDQGKWEEAKEQFVNIPPDHEKCDSAREYIRKCDFEGLMKKARQFLCEGKIPEAKACAESARIIDPGREEPVTLLSDVEKAKGLYDDAKNVLSRNPLSLEDWRTGVGKLNEFLEKCPDCKEVRERRDRVQGEIEQIEDWLKKARDARDRGDFAEAEKCVNEVLKLDPANDEAKKIQQWAQEERTKKAILDTLSKYDDAYQHLRVNDILSLIDPERKELKKELESELNDIIVQKIEVKRAKHEETQVIKLENDCAAVSCIFNVELYLPPDRTVKREIKRTVKLVRRAGNWCIEAFEDESSANK